MQPEGNGSVFAYWDENTRKGGLAVFAGLNKIEAQYQGLLAVLKRVRVGGLLVEIVSDDPLFNGQFYGLSPIRGHRLQVLRTRMVMLLRKRQLEIVVVCVPKADNRAWKLLRRQRSREQVQKLLEQWGDGGPSKITAPGSIQPPQP